MIKMKIKLLSLFIVILIISMTPASAAEMGEVFGSDNNSYPVDQGQLEALQNYGTQMGPLAEVMQADMDKFNTKVEELLHIPWYRIDRILTTVFEIKDLYFSIKDKAARLQTVTNSSGNGQTQSDKIVLPGEVSETNLSDLPLVDIIYNATGHNPIPNMTYEEFLNLKIADDTNQIDQETEGITNDTELLNQTLDELDKIPLDIVKKRIHLLTLKTIQILKISKDLLDHSQSLNTTATDLNWTQNELNNIEVNATNDNSPAYDQAVDMANKLSIAFAPKNFTVKPTLDSGGLHVGDVVNYRTNDNYYRYVKIYNITDNSVTIQGENHQTANISKQSADDRISYVLVPSTYIDSYTVVHQAYNLQDKDIQALQDKAKTQENAALGLEISAGALGMLAGSIGLYVLRLHYKIKALKITKKATYVLLRAGISAEIRKLEKTKRRLEVLGVTLTIAAAALAVCIAPIKVMANDNKDKADNAEEDLNNFLSVSSSGHVPVAGNMSVITAMNKDWVGVCNATDEDGDLVNAIIVSAPKHGNITVNGTRFVYTPADGYLGNDSLTYKVKDSKGFISKVATVNIQVVNDNSINITLNDTAQNLTYTIAKDKALNLNISSNGKIVLVQSVLHGNSTLADSVFGHTTIQYIPFKDYMGTDSLAYRLQLPDGRMSNIAWINIKIS